MVEKSLIMPGIVGRRPLLNAKKSAKPISKTPVASTVKEKKIVKKKANVVNKSKSKSSKDKVKDMDVEEDEDFEEFPIEPGDVFNVQMNIEQNIWKPTAIVHKRLLKKYFKELNLGLIHSNHIGPQHHEYFVHYLNYDSRLDEWVDINRIDSRFNLKGQIIGLSQSELYDSDDNMNVNMNMNMNMNNDWVNRNRHYHHHDDNKSDENQQQNGNGSLRISSNNNNNNNKNNNNNNDGSSIGTININKRVDVAPKGGILVIDKNDRDSVNAGLGSIGMSTSNVKDNGNGNGNGNGNNNDNNDNNDSNSNSNTNANLNQQQPQPHTSSSILRKSKKIYNVRTLQTIQLGQHFIDTWYTSCYPIDINSSSGSSSSGSSSGSGSGSGGGGGGGSSNSSMSSTGTHNHSGLNINIGHGNGNGNGNSSGSGSANTQKHTHVHKHTHTIIGHNNMNNNPQRIREKLFLCSYCLDYKLNPTSLFEHRCPLRNPPGKIIYKDPIKCIAMWEVDGKSNTLYCQNCK